MFTVSHNCNQSVCLTLLNVQAVLNRGLALEALDLFYRSAIIICRFAIVWTEYIIISFMILRVIFIVLTIKCAINSQGSTSNLLIMKSPAQVACLQTKGTEFTGVDSVVEA